MPISEDMKSVFQTFAVVQSEHAAQTLLMAFFQLVPWLSTLVNQNDLEQTVNKEFFNKGCRRPAHKRFIISAQLVLTHSKSVSHTLQFRAIIKVSRLRSSLKLGME